MTVKSKKTIKRFWIIYFSSLGILSILFLCIAMGWFGFMPSFEELENPKSNLATEIYSADQVILGKYYIENRSNIHFNDLAPHLINALIATEDARFEKHSGVDSKAIARVVFGVITGSSKGGGSTITQQLAKNLFPRKKNTSFIEMIIIKLKEWVTAIKLEHNYTKEEIIAMYFNTVDFGSQSFGIKSAAKTYFDKTPDSLNVVESALLVGILKAPTLYSPIRNPQNAINRRDVVLHQMMKYNYISEQEYDSLRRIPIDMSHYCIQDHTAGLATYFREYLREYLTTWANEHYKTDGSSYNIYKDGLRVYTTINSKMQKYAEEAVSEHLGGDLQPAFYKHWKGRVNAPFQDLNKEQIKDLIRQSMLRSDRYINMKKAGVSDADIEKEFKKPVQMRVFSWTGERDTTMSPLDSLMYYKYFLLAGLMSMEPQTGYVRAYVGGINYKHFQYDHVIRSKRQVGSTFKPIIYTLAMQDGEFSPCSKVPNVPVSIDIGNGDKWEPKNSDNAREGEMVTLKWALAHSVNWVSGYLIKRYSPTAVVKTARKMGIKSDIPPVYSLSLGSVDLSLYEMVGAMNTFADKGVYIEPIFITRIEDKHGNVIESFAPKKEEAMSEETAYLMLTLMKGVVEEGTGVRLRYKFGLQCPIAGKTGTTQNQSDGWFMGITPDLVTGIWVGCEDRSVHFRGIDLGQGANMALPIWAIYMKKIYADPTIHISQGDFERPSKPISVEMNCDKYEAKNKKKRLINERDF